MASTPPPGMYIDPDNPHLQRFWNGTAWTDHVQPLDGAASAGAPMYAPPPRNASPPPMPMGPPTTPPPYGAPPPDPTSAAFPAPTPYPTGTYGAAGLSMHMRPLSQAAVWSIVFALLCPLVGVVMSIVAINATGANGDRRGRAVAIVGLVLSLLNMVVGFFIAAGMASQTGTTGTGTQF